MISRNIIKKSSLTWKNAIPQCKKCFCSKNDDQINRPQVTNTGDDKEDGKYEKLLSSQSLPGEPPSFPSDLDDDMLAWNEFNKKYRSQPRHSARPKDVAPHETSILLFPGQGAQFIGMGKELLQYPTVNEMYKVASSILGYDLLRVCLEGPRDKLDRTEYCQPAVVVTALAAVEKLRHENLQAIESCVSTAGFSVGEYAALVFADALSFEDAVHVVKKRAKLMQKMSEKVPSGMMTVITGADSKLNYCLHTAKLYCSQELGMEKPVCHIAISLYPEVKVIAGHAQALDFVEKNGREFGVRRTKRLPVSGAFHTNLMKEGRHEFTKVLESVEIRKPLIPVYSNVTSHRYKSPAGIKTGLVQQLYKPVKWEQTMHVLYERPKGQLFPQTYEMGPGNQLGTILSKTNRLAHELLKYVSV